MSKSPIAFFLYKEQNKTVLQPGSRDLSKLPCDASELNCFEFRGPCRQSRRRNSWRCDQDPRRSSVTLQPHRLCNSYSHRRGLRTGALADESKQLRERERKFCAYDWTLSSVGVRSRLPQRASLICSTASNIAPRFGSRRATTDP